MWRYWKKEIIGILAAVILGIILIVFVTNSLLEAKRNSGGYKSHLTVGGVTYWISSAYAYPELPDGYEEVAEVEVRVAGNVCAEADGQSNVFDVGTPIYRNETQPGWVYVPAADNRWTRLTVMELQKEFLRYDSKLYVSIYSFADEIKTVQYKPDELVPTGKILTWIGYDLVPVEDCTTNQSDLGGDEICLNPAQQDTLVVKSTRTRDGKTETDYHPFITADSLGLDYSAYEWLEFTGKS